MSKEYKESHCIDEVYRNISHMSQLSLEGLVDNGEIYRQNQPRLTDTKDEPNGLLAPLEDKEANEWECQADEDKTDYEDDSSSLQCQSLKEDN